MTVQSQITPPQEDTTPRAPLKGDFVLRQPLSSQQSASSALDLSHLIAVHRRSDDTYRTYATSKVDLPAGALFARVTGTTPAQNQDFGTVQAGRGLHVKWNSDIYFINHGCAPNLQCDWKSMELRVSRDCPVKVGDVLSLFYPSTEWVLDREFDCWCGAEGCLGKIRGARDMNIDLLKGYWLNGYIRDMLQERARVEEKLGSLVVAIAATD